ncbi:hypothetical protein V8C42DRAFT_362194 [Trichoderma barbatum]
MSTRQFTTVLTLIASIILMEPGIYALPGTSRTELQRHDISIQGHETVQEVIFVLEGEIEYQIDGQKPETLKAGEVIFIPTGVVHQARNVGNTTGAELATYIVKKGPPLVHPVK